MNTVLEYIMIHYGNLILKGLLYALAACLAIGAAVIWRGALKDKTKREIAVTAVKFAEQAWKTLHGKEKLLKALETAEKLLRKKKIPFDAEEMMILIEAALAELNRVFWESVADPLNEGATADAVRREDEFQEDCKDTVICGFAGENAI